MALLAQVQTMSRFEQAFVSLVDRALASPALIVAAVAAAFGVGALHALAPGHGKSIAAAYLVAGRGRVRDAVLLGAAVAVMHSLSVVVLALGLDLFLRRSDTPMASATTVTPVLRILSGLIVVGLGVGLLVGHVRRRREHDDAAHHDHHHDDPPPGPTPFSRRGLLVLGASGGLLPSPSAFLVLVTTSFSGRLGLGLLLVGVFSLGLAATVTVIGVAVVRGRQVLVDRLDTQGRQRLLARLRLAGAVVVTAGGVVLTAAGIAAL